MLNSVDAALCASFIYSSYLCEINSVISLKSRDGIPQVELGTHPQ